MVNKSGVRDEKGYGSGVGGGDGDSGEGISAELMVVTVVKASLPWRWCCGSSQA